MRKFKESRGRERILSYTEEDALLAQLPQLHATIVRLALEVGARLQSELLPLTWDDLDLDKAPLRSDAQATDRGDLRIFDASKQLDLAGAGTLTLGASAGIRLSGYVRVRGLAIDYSASASVYGNAPESSIVIVA